MAENDITNYQNIKGLDVMEYWALFDSWKKRKEAEQKAREKQAQANKSKK